jgi:hypothetical protein
MRSFSFSFLSSLLLFFPSLLNAPANGFAGAAPPRLAAALAGFNHDAIPGLALSGAGDSRRREQVVAHSSWVVELPSLTTSPQD